MPQLAILGRQPAISLAELVSLFPDKVQSLTPEAAIIDLDEVNLNKLGGTVKLAALVHTFPITDLASIITKIAGSLPQHLSGSKPAIGLSLYGLKVNPKTAFAASLELKKHLKSTGLSVRIVPGLRLDAAQIQHNHMISRGADVVVLATKDTIYVGITKQVQDIEHYARRDHGRPYRDPKVGMLPPKLAQIMINMANPLPKAAVLDPFCGTGVILQEALLMGYPAYGSDIEPLMADMTRENLSWLSAQFGSLPDYRLSIGDATTMQWDKPIGAVVTEGYLGPSLTTNPVLDQVKLLATQSSTLALSFLANIASQINPGTPVCMALPAWRTGDKLERLSIVDQIQTLGYTLKQFLPVHQSDLLYARSNQIVGRELITLIRK